MDVQQQGACTCDMERCDDRRVTCQRIAEVRARVKRSLLEAKKIISLWWLSGAASAHAQTTPFE